MLRLASDADVPGPLIRGLRHREPTIDLVRVQEVGLRTALDPVILNWAAGEGRILLTRDRETMIGFAYDRVRVGLPMPGLLVLSNRMSYQQAIDDILLIAVSYTEDEMKNRVVFLPI
jgi:predicted nuclease of predicted toxin-antitoxin system